MTQRRARSVPVLAPLWLLVGLAMVVVTVWLAVTRLDPLLSGHPITLAVGFAVLVIGLVAVGLSVVVLVDRFRARREPRNEKTGPGTSRRHRIVVIASIPALVVCLVATGLLAYSRPLPATDLALVAMRTTSTVKITERLTSFDLIPTREDRRGRPIKVTTGVIFYPGARVDARAYAAQLRPLAEAGFLVVVCKEPFGLAMLDLDQGRGVLDLHPEIIRWAVGGHSLGGLGAATLAQDDPRITGLVLYASEPLGPVTRTDLRVLSISASNDGLQTPDRIAESKAKLPPTTTYLVIDGSVHAYFGDYGPQPGDGAPRITRAAAQRQTVVATQKFLAGLPAPNTAAKGAPPKSTALKSTAAKPSPSKKR